MVRKTRALVVIIATLVGLVSTPAHAQNSQIDMSQCRLYGNNENSLNRFEDSGHVKDWSRILKPSGTLSAIVIPTDFADAPGKKPAKTELTFLRSTSRFFETASQGKFNLEFDTSLDWVRMPKTARHYEGAFWADKISDAIDTVNPSIDFSKYDLIIIYISKDNLITTEAGALPGFPDRTTDGVSPLRGVYLGNDGWRQQGQHASVLIHELLHVFGLPDLYMPNSDGTKNVGVFDIMSEYTKSLGPRLFYWHRWKLDWIDNSQVRCLDPIQKQTVFISTRNANNFIWVLPISDSVVEVIQPWINGKKVQAIAYRVDTKDFVWNTAGLQGSGESPIQMLRPARAGLPPKTFSNRNLNVVLRDKDRISGELGNYNVSTKGNQVIIRYSPQR